MQDALRKFGGCKLAMPGPGSLWGKVQWGEAEAPVVLWVSHRRGDCPPRRPEDPGRLCFFLS